MKKNAASRMISLFLAMIILLTAIGTVTVASVAENNEIETGFNSVQMTVGSSATLSSGSSGTVVWHNSAPGVVTVKNGKLTAKSKGSAVVYVTEGTKTLKTWLVTVGDFNGSLTLNLNATSSYVSNSVTLSVSGAVGALKWRTGDPSVATVDNSGKILATGLGTTVITVQNEAGTQAASCVFHVLQSTGTISKTTATVAVGQTFYNKFTTTVSTVSWTSNHPEIATVNNGFIVGVSEGTATISVSAPDGTGAQCKVTVTKAEPIYTAYLSPNNVTAGQEAEAVIVAAPSAANVGVTIRNAQNTILLNAAAATHEDKTVNGRTVRIWHAPLTAPAEAGSYKLCAYCTGSAENAVSVPIFVRTAEETAVANCASDALLTFLTQNEGLCETVQYDVVNVPTIGYGRALYVGYTFYNNETSEEAWGNMVSLVNDVFTKELNAFVKYYKLPITQQQYDALIDFAYNMGAYCWRNYDFYLRRLLIASVADWEAIDETQLKYAFGRHSVTGGYFYTGLWRRRLDEWEMFLRGDYALHSTVTSATTGEFALPTSEERSDPNMYKSDWTYVGAQY